MSCQVFLCILVHCLVLVAAMENTSDFMCLQMLSLRVGTKKAEWINDEYLELRRQSMRVKHLANINRANNDELYRTAKVLQNRLNNLGVKLKRQYFCKILYDNKGNTKNVWTTLKRLLPSKKSTVTYTPTEDKTQELGIANHC